MHFFIPRDYPPYIQGLFPDTHFLANIRGYNQMFAMTSLGASVDDTINVIKVSGHIYHRIGRMYPV